MKNNKGINVLSLFDGMSCGQIALKELGVKINKYYASEIDKHAIKQTMLNFPNTIQLGDVTKWKEWDIDWKSIDLVIGGFCCQSFSSAGNQKGFNDDRGQLFFDFADIVDNVIKNNPGAKFLGENVRMSKEHQAVIDERLGVRPVEINSSLVSAQNRVRLYWTNIRTKEVGLFGELHSDIPQPKDRGIYLKDILEEEVDDKFYLSDKAINGLLQHEERNNENGNGFGMDVRSGYDKSQTVIAGGKGHLWKTDGKSYCLDTGCTTAVELVRHETPKIVGNTDEKFEQESRVFSINGKSPTLLANRPQEKSKILKNRRIRRLTPTECARLQTIPDWYKWECSDTQQYKMLGNGWTIEVIKHIFSFIQL